MVLLIDKNGFGLLFLIQIGVHLLHLTPPEVTFFYFYQGLSKDKGKVFPSTGLGGP
jgi:hypothetical protein